METMRLTEKKKSSKGVIIGLSLFFIIGTAILILGIKAEEEPVVIGNSTDEQTQRLVDVEKENKEALKEQNKNIEYNVADKKISDTSNKKMKANMILPVITVDSEELTVINEDINKYYNDMYSSLKEEMASANSKYTYKVTYNVYDNMVEEKKIISITIYERIIDDSNNKTTMDKIKTYNIDAVTKEQITQSNDIALTFFGKDYKTIIRDAIKEYVVSNSMIKEKDFNYTYTGVKPFYIKDAELHLIFNEGELVDAKHGVLDITVKK